MADDENKGCQPKRYYGGGINFWAVANWVRDWRERRSLEWERQERLRDWRNRD